jgi:predicted nucleic acid-binding protein
MKVYFDTNTVIDILKRREPHFSNSNAIFMLAVNEKIEGIINASSITDIFYILKKEFADTKKTISIVFDILEIVKPVDVLVYDLYSAAKLDFLDFEDAVIEAVARREKVEYIITRNKSDFINSIIPVVTPEEFLILFNSSLPR